MIEPVTDDQPGVITPGRPPRRLIRSRSEGAPPIYRQHSFLTWIVIFVVIALVVPNTFSSLSNQFQVNVWLDYALAGVGFYWVFGLAGRFAFCQTFMMALGGYMSAYLTAKLGSGWYLEIGRAHV